MSTQDSTTNSTSGTSQAAEQNASFQHIQYKKKQNKNTHSNKNGVVFFITPSLLLTQFF